MRQSLKILQVPALELRTTIQEELQSNPLLEELPMETTSVDETSGETTEAGGENGEATDRDLEFLKELDDDWRDAWSQNGDGNRNSREAIKRREHFFESIVSETSLQEHLMAQADLADATPEERIALEYLIGTIDDRGFLSQPIREIALLSGLPLDSLQSAWEILKSFDPHGIGAADLRDCLLQQLKLNKRESSTAAVIVRDHFDLLLRRRIPEIARQLGRAPSEIEDAIEEIAALDPAPGRRFSEDQNRVVVPDVKVERDDDDWIVTLNDEYIPRLRISSTYKDMIAGGKLSSKEKEYIREKIRSGKFLISSIEQRQQTIEKITREILRAQNDFFDHGISKLRPLTMMQVAEKVGVHETTVSRAIANKYIDTPHGVFEFKYFFTPGYQSAEGESVSNKSIKDIIAHLIENEDPEKPLSDMKIADLLAKRNLTVARRTVAKYREAMGILPTNLRRQYH